MSERIVIAAINGIVQIEISIIDQKWYGKIKYEKIIMKRSNIKIKI